MNSNLRIQQLRNICNSLSAVFAASLLAMSLSACHATIGTPDGIREYYRGINGAIEQGKASPDKETAYWATQKQQDGLRLGVD